VRPPAPTTILGDVPALVLQCTRRAGGWPQVALVAQIGGAGWLADGVLPALPAMQRSIGVLSGRVSASAAPSLGADSLLADRLAARAFSSNDVGQYETLMTAGQRANRAGDFGAAERAYRAARQLQEKALGRDNPNVVNALMSLALQLSNQGRAIEADALFARADGLASHATDGSSVARLAHYRGLNALNQGHFDDALARLRRAETMYAALVPPDRLTARQPAKLRGFNTSLLPGQNTLSDLTTQDALLGIIEARRNQGIALRELGRPTEGEAVVERARSFAIDVGLNQSIVSARVSRTMCVGFAAAGKPEEAASDLDAAGAAFQRGAPATKPVAMTALLRAKELAATNRTAEALASCHGAFALLASLKAGAEPALVAPCLNAYYAEAGRQVANRQALLAEMFSAAQLAQGGVTSKQIAQATARLLENARDPKVAVAIRVQEDAAAALTQLYRRRDEQVQDRAQGIAVSAEAQAAQDKKLSDAQAAAAEADEALQAASPNYGQLVQQAVSAADVMAALHPGEAFASIALTDTDGFVLLLHDGTIDAARIAGGGPRMTALVKTLRASIEPTATLPTFDVAASIELYTALFGSLRLDGVKTLVVAPTGALLSLPFEVLLTGPADAGLAGAPWLVRRMSIAHVPAPSNFVSLRKLAGTSRARQPWFGFGDFKPVTTAQAEHSFPGQSCADSAKLLAGLPPLPFAIRELAAARALLGASHDAELLGPAFTAAAVVKTRLKDYRILHFATHALLPAELQCQSEAAIITSDPAGAAGAADASGALLTASAVTGMDLDADSIILSACNSGGPGGGAAGESLSGLARSFFYAGARSLLVTHWSVNDQAAAFLIADTLRRYRETPSLGMVDALQQAQLGIIDDAGKGLPASFSHPFYWAPFALIGEGSGVTTARS